MASRPEEVPLDHDNAQPTLETGTWKGKRRYSPTDFRKLTSGLVSIGSRQLSRTTINCQLPVDKCHWGRLGHKQYPAGIIYLMLDFGPLQGDCRVTSATVTVTLDDQDDVLSARGDKTVKRHDEAIPARMTQFYGPQSGLVGPPKSSHVTDTSKFDPTVAVTNVVDLSGVSHERSKVFTRFQAWTFSSHLLPGERDMDRSIHRSIKWDFHDNKLEEQAFHSNLIHTAFTFEHSGQPFLMKVKIEGKLDRWVDRVRSKLKFGREAQLLTLVEFRDYRLFSKVLDNMAERVAADLRDANLRNTLIKMLDDTQGQSSGHTAGNDDVPLQVKDDTASQVPLESNPTSKIMGDTVTSFEAVYDQQRAEIIQGLCQALQELSSQKV